MQKLEFVTRFLLNNLQPSFHHFIYPKALKDAAVLIPIVEADNQLNVLLTRRAEHLKHHPGQVSFPGGKVEKSDENFAAAALREAHEEIGLPCENVNILGQLKPYHTISGYVVTPFVGLIEQPEAFIQDDNEVAEIFQVPLQHFINQDNHFRIETFFRGEAHSVNFMPYKQYNIWGATAAMMIDLVHHIR